MAAGRVPAPPPATGAGPPARPMAPATILWLVAGLSMLQPLSTDLYLPALPRIAAGLDAPVATVQWTLSIFVAGFGVWQLVVGPLSDRYGRVPVVRSGIVIYIGASVLCMVAPTIEVLIAGRLLQAVGACGCLVGGRGMVRDLFAPAAGAHLLARAATVMAIAPLAGPVIGAYAVEHFGWRAAFALVLLFAFGLAAFALMQMRETNHHRSRRSMHPRALARGYLRVAASPPFRAYTLAASASYAGLFAYISGSAFVLITVMGLSTTAYGFAYATMVAGYVVGTLVCRRLLPRRGVQRTVFAGAVLQAAAALTLVALAVAGVHRPAAFIGPMIVYGIAHGMLQPPTQAGALAPFARSAGTASATFGFVMMTIAASIGLLMGLTWNGTPYPLAFTIGASGCATLAIALLLVRRDGDISRHG